MKLLCVLLLTCTFGFAYTQETKKPARKARLSIGFTFSPDYSSRTLKNNDDNASTDLVIDSRNHTETGKFGYTTGFAFNVHFTDHLSFETGILYSNKGYRTKSQDLFFPLPSQQLPTSFRAVHNYRYIDIPLKVNFTAGKKKTRFIAGAGIAVNFLTKSSQVNTYEYADGHTETNKQPIGQEHKDLNISPFISLGLEYQTSGNTYIRAEPMFRYGIIKLFDTPITECLWNAGLNIGFYYRFKR